MISARENEPMLARLPGLIGGYFTNVILLYIAFCISFISSKLIHLPEQNAYNISNLYASAGFNPEINYVHILWIIGMGAAIYVLLRGLLKRRPGLFRLFVALFIASGIFGSSIMPKINNYVRHIDTFHQGEQLSPGSAFLHGKHLFTDLFVLHGAGEDVLFPAASFHIPGTPADGGIGSYFFLSVTLQVLSVVMFILFLARYLRSTPLFLGASFWFVFSAYSNFYYARDVTVWGILILLWYVFQSQIKARSRYMLLGAVGIIASASLFYSIDRGFIAMFLALACAGILLFTETAGAGNVRKLSFPKRFESWRNSLAIAAGVAATQVIFAAIFGLNQYIEFIRTTFITIPKYQGLMFNYPLPDATGSSYTLWLPVFLAALGTLMLGRLVLWDYRRKLFSPDVLLLTILMLTSILFLRVGYGRSDWGHIAYSTPLLFATLFILAYAFWSKAKTAGRAPQLWMPLLFASLLLFPVNTVTAASLTTFPSVIPGVAKDYLKLPARKDRDWLPPDVAQVVDYVKANSSSKDRLFVFTQQPIYYYLTQRENPTRFYISWFADPQPLTNEMLADLNHKPPKIIIYSSGDGWDNPDGYYMVDRAPEVDAWIKTNYPHEVKMGPITLRTK